MHSTRHLVAIMFTDIVGYTTLMANDQAKAFSILNKNRELQKAVIEQNHGSWIKELGDGVLASFHTVTEAVNAAMEIQRQSIADNEFSLRIGIHLGEVVFESGDIFGDGVNIASRIQSAARPGSIFVSSKVYDELKNRPDISAVSMGKFSLKNVKGEMELFAISVPGIKMKLTVTAETLKGVKCILVLPFVNISADKEQEYFSDGLTEELIARLSRLTVIRVISRTTSMQYKHTSKDIKTIRNETDASYIMEGSVRKYGNNLRITAQFIDAVNDVHLWAETYNGTIEDIFDIQEKVSSRIVEALRLHISKVEAQKFQKRYTENTEAYQFYLKGRHFWKMRTLDSLHTAIHFFEAAIKIDKDYALAWAGLADSYTLLGEYANVGRRDVAPKIMEAVDRALEIDPHLAEAHISKATQIMLIDWNWEESEKEFKLGIALNPHYATGHHWYAEWLWFHGRMQQAYDEISLALNLDPVSQAIAKDKGLFYYYNRQYDEAIEMANKSLELDAVHAPAHRVKALAYTAKKMFNEALKSNAEWGRLSGNKIKTDVALAHIYAEAGRKDEAKKLLEEIENKVPLSENDYRGMALVYASLNNKDKAFEWLYRSYEQQEESLCSIMIDPKLDPLKHDTRFNDLLRKIKLVV